MLRACNRVRPGIFTVAVCILLAPPILRADIITEWNNTTITLVDEAIKGPPPANRAIALVQTSVYEAVNAITQRYSPSDIAIDAPKNASIDAAVATATKRVLDLLLPKSQQQINKAYTSAINQIPMGQSRTDGINVGLQAAEAVLQARALDKVGVKESYRPETTPGTYVPTVIPVASTWIVNRVPWALSSVDQLRPAAPPALTSERWAQDFNEIKSIGFLYSNNRTPEQTAAAHFWVATSPTVYFPVVQSVTRQPGRDITRNARLFAMTSQAIDDALIAVFDAKYAYNFWRPMTAIRNGDRDGNEQTERKSDWKPLIETPMHPEYPCAHCIVSGSVGTVIKIDIGTDAIPTLQTASPTDSSIVRTWDNPDAFMQEVANARVWEGVHYRFSAQTGTQMGKEIARLVVDSFQAAN